MKNIFFIIYLFSCSPALAIECDSKQYAVKAHHRKAYIRADGTSVSESSVKAHCKDRSISSIYFQERIKDERPLNWPHKNEQTSSWSEEEKVRTIEALEDLPKILRADALKGLYRMKRSKDFPNPASFANGTIVLYDSAFEAQRNLSRIIAHELAHQLFMSSTKEQKRDYRLATGWKLEPGPDLIHVYWESRAEGYVEDDGRTSVEEDYANNLEYFIFAPDKLKVTTPMAYEWLKKEYGHKLELKREKK